MLLEKFYLMGETQQRERILIPFSNRYHECNTPDYGSAGEVPHFDNIAMFLATVHWIRLLILFLNHLSLQQKPSFRCCSYAGVCDNAFKH